MRKHIIAGLLLSSALFAGAQQRFPPINLYNGDPTGNTCTGNLIQQSETTGLLYTCQAGAMKVQGNPATGNVIASPQYSLFYQPSTGTTASAQGDPNVTTDGAGNVAAKSAGANLNSVVYVKSRIYNAACNETQNIGTISLSSPNAITGSGFTAISGEQVVVPNAGTIQGDGSVGPLITTVTNATSTQITTADAASTAVTSALFYVGFNDQVALQAAVNDGLVGSSNPSCTVLGCQVQFPAGACLTSTVVYHGQPFFGSGMLTSTVQGMPGQDVFQVPDSAGALPQSTHVHDIKIAVDGSLNAAATAGGGNNTFPNRITGTAGGTTALPALSGGPPAPGQVNFGPSTATGSCSASVTAGSAVLTGTCQAFSNAAPPSIIGAPITVNGAGTQTAITAWSITSNVATFTASNSFTAGQSVFMNGFGTSTFFNNQYATVLAAGLSGSQFEITFVHANGSATEAGSAGGGNLVTTILSTTGNTVTMAANSNVTGTTLAGKWGTPLNAPWYIGNCGMAIPHSDQNVSIVGPNGWHFQNVYFYSTNFGTPSDNYKHECGLFMQAQPYDMHFTNVTFQGMWAGWVEALPALNFTSAVTWTPDTTTCDGMIFSSTMIAATWYNGSHRTCGIISVYTANTPFALGLWHFVYGSNVAQLDIDRYYHEGWTSNSGEISRFGGSNGSVKGGNMLQTYTYAPPNDQYINVTGNANTITAQAPSIHVAGTINTTRNIWPGSGANGYFTDAAAGDNDLETYYANNGMNRRFVMNRSRTPSNQPDSSWLLGGTSLTPFTSGQDLIATCNEFNMAFAAVFSSPGCTSDQNDQGNIYGSYLHATLATYATGWVLGSGGTQGTMIGKEFTIGDRIPQGLVNISVIARCDQPCTQIFTLRNVRTNSNVGAGQTLSFGTTWTAAVSASVDLSGTQPGDIINIIAGAISGSSVTYEDVQSVGFQPVPADTLKAVTTSSAVRNLISTGAAGTTFLNAAAWTWGTTAADATSPVGYSSTVTNASSITAVTGAANLNGGCPPTGLYCAVPSDMTALTYGATIWTDTLGGSMLSTDTTMTITTAVTSAWPGCGTTCTLGYLQIGQEIVKFAAPTVGATTLTITRAQFGTTAQAHANLATYTSVGQGNMQVICNSVTLSSVPVVFTPSWNYFQGPFFASGCSGFATSFRIGSIGADFSGQVYKMAAIVVSPQANLPVATAAGQTPVSVNTGVQFPFTSVALMPIVKANTTNQWLNSYTASTGAFTSTQPAFSNLSGTATFAQLPSLTTITTATNCANSASPAVCAAAPSGAVAMPTGVNPTLVINTTAVTANSRIVLTVDDSLTIPSTTCNSTLATLVGGMAITARSAATSFTVSYNGTITTNPLCFSYVIVN